MTDLVPEKYCGAAKRRDLGPAAGCPLAPPSCGSLLPGPWRLGVVVAPNYGRDL